MSNYQLPKTPTVTFLIRYQNEAADSETPGRLTFVDSSARDGVGIPEVEEMACESVKRFINDYYGWDCVGRVEIEVEDA